MRFMSDFREAMWGVVQRRRRSSTSTSTTTRDSTSSAAARTAADPRFARWLEEARVARRRVSCPSRARCVIIGGGVGGAVDRLPPGPARLRATWSCWSAPSSPSGSTFHSAGAGGAAARLGDADEDDDALGRALPAASRASRSSTPAGASGRHPAAPRSAERMEELRRQAGWAKTFGLPMELVSAEEAQELFPLMVDRRRAGRRLAAHRRLPRSRRSSPTRSPTARARGGARCFTNTRVTGIDVDARARARGAHRARRRSRPRWW